MLVSVVMPTYNAGDLLRDAVGSLAKQAHLTAGVDYELIIADDGSSDTATTQALSDLGQLTWCNIVSTGGRRGAAYARNLAASASQGQWLAFLDSDDLFSYEALSIRLSVADRHPDADCIATDYVEFDDAPKDVGSSLGALAGSKKKRAALAPAFESGKSLALTTPLHVFLASMPLWTGATMVRRPLFQQMGGFPEQLRVAEDLFLWLRISASAVVAFDPRITAFYRNTAHSLTADRVELFRATANCYRALLQAPGFGSATEALTRQIAASHREESYAARQVNRYARSALAGLDAVWCAPGDWSNWLALAKSFLPARQ